MNPKSGDPISPQTAHAAASIDSFGAGTSPRSARRLAVKASAPIWALTAALCIPFGTARAQADGSVCQAYWEQRYDQALELAKKIVAQPNVALDDKLSAYRCEACTHVARKQIVPAKESIAGMLQLDATARFSPDTDYPPPVLELYHSVRDSLFPGTMDVRTIAIGDFEDNSIYTGAFKDYDFSLFQKALLHTISADLAAATDLKLVDRQRITQIKDEIRLGQSDFADPQQAVRAGQLLGAHTFIFGQYMILSKDTVRIDARVVKTATGEVLLTKQVTGQFSGDPAKFLELEQELVTAIARGIDQVLAANEMESHVEEDAQSYFARKRTTINNRPDYVESKFLVAMALESEDSGDYQQAREAWKRVLEVDPANEVAPVRIQVLETILQS